MAFEYIDANRMSDPFTVGLGSKHPQMYVASREGNVYRVINARPRGYSGMHEPSGPITNDKGETLAVKLSSKNPMAQRVIDAQSRTLWGSTAEEVENEMTLRSSAHGDEDWIQRELGDVGL